MRQKWFEREIEQNKDRILLCTVVVVLEEYLTPAHCLSLSLCSTQRLGHESLLDKRASMKFAEGIAKKKVNEQPEKPLGAAEVLENMPMTAM